METILEELQAIRNDLGKVISEPTQFGTSKAAEVDLMVLKTLYNLDKLIVKYQLT